MKKLLVTGISGFLGRYIAKFHQQEWTITGLYHKQKFDFPGVVCLSCDISNAKEMEQIFKKIQPEAVLHLAALSNPNYCETHPEISRLINVDSTLHLAKLCKEAAIPFLFTSTDLVFDGTQAPYKETDPVNPIMIYGKHKALAEEKVLGTYPEAMIARLPVMYGEGGFMSNWIKTLQDGGRISAFRDEYRSMVSAAAAAEGLYLLLNKKVKGIRSSEIGQVWHLGGKERISRFDFAVKMAKAFELPLEKILSSLRKEIKMPAARPADVTLDSRKAFELGYHPLTIEEELELIKSSYS